MANMIIGSDRYAVIASRIRSAGDGLIAEVGVAEGGVVENLSREFPERTIYAYDTFSGLPAEKWQEGEIHHPGEFQPGNAEACLSRLSNVVVRKGIFPNTLGDETGFVVVHLDVDFYLSTLEALKALLPRMVHGGRIILDDWKWRGCPGVERAVKELGLTAIPTCPMQAEILAR